MYRTAETRYIENRTCMYDWRPPGFCEIFVNPHIGIPDTKGSFFFNTIKY